MANWKINIVVLWFGQFMTMAGMTMIIPFLPLYIQELGITDPKAVSMWAGVIFAGNFVTAFLFQPFWGKISDRYGRKMMLLRSGFGMSIVMMLMGLSGNVWHLLLLRILNGTVSGFVPAATALVAANTPKEKAGFAMGIMQSGVVGGTILGPLIGGLLATHVGFSSIFYITGGILLVATALSLWLVNENFDRKKAREAANISVIAGFQELRRVPQLPSLFIATLMIQFAIVGVMPQIPLYIQQMHGDIELLAFYAGLVGSVTGLSNMISSPIAGKLGDKVGPALILFLCLIASALIYIPQAFVTDIWQLLTVRFILGLFIGGLLPMVNALVRRYTPDGMEGRAYSFNTSFFSLGNLLGPLICGFLVGYTGIGFIFILCSALLFISAIWVWRRLPLRTPAPAQKLDDPVSPQSDPL